MSENENEQTQPMEGIEVKVDASQIKEEVLETVKQLIEANRPAEDDGKGEVAECDEMLEQLESIAERLKENPLKEQWTVALPVTTKEITGHLRDHCFLSPVLKGKQGDTVNVPYVTDFDFEILSNVGDAFADSLGTVYATTTATLQEAGGWTRVPYKDIEKINANLLDEINKAFVNAAYRAEDRVILEALDDLTTNQLAGAIDRSTAAAYFYAASIPQAIGKLLQAGKQANPGECVAYLTAAAYGALLEELAASQPAAFATPDVLRTGRVTDYMGVRIVVGAPWALWTKQVTTTPYTYKVCFLGRYKRGVVLAPKRELLLETEKDTVTRSQKMTGSHTLAVKVLDGKEFVRIATSELAS